MAARRAGPAVSATAGSILAGIAPISRSRVQTGLSCATIVTIAEETGPAVSRGKGETICGACSETALVAAMAEGEILGQAP